MLPLALGSGRVSVWTGSVPSRSLRPRLSDLFRPDLTLLFFQIRLYARPDAIASGAGDYALHITRRLLGFYQDYFKVQYSLPKLGKAAVSRWRWCGAPIGRFLSL